MDCNKAAELFNAYIDGELSAATVRDLEAHSAVCPSCAANLASLKALNRALVTLPQQDLPPGFNQALHQKLAAEPAPPKPALWQRGWVKAIAAAACLLLVIGAVAVVNQVVRGNRIYYGSSEMPSSSTMASAPMAAPAADMNESMQYFTDEPEMAFDMAVAEESAAMPFEQGINTARGGEAMSITGSAEKQMEQKIIRDVHISLRVDSFSNAYQSLNELAGRYDGYVVSSDAYDYADGQMRSGYIMLRVDAGRLDEALNEIDALGKVENKSINTQDITMAYYDIAGRLEQYQLQEKRLLDIMAKAETVEDLIQLEKELTRVRADLESLIGQLRYYDQMTALSSISVTLYQPDDNTQTVRLSGWAGFAQDLREGLISGLNGLLQGLSALAVSLARMLPTLLLLAVAGLIVALFFKKRRRR